MNKKSETNDVVVTLQAPDIRVVKIPIVGTAPLVCNQWSKKAKQQILDTQQKKPKGPKAIKNPEEDYLNSLYHIGDGKYGFPSIAFKSAMVRAGTYADMKMTFLRGAFHILGDLVEIIGTPVMRQDMVRVGMGLADIRFRGEFKEWEIELPITYNASVISVAQLMNLVMLAGFSVGVGEWRPEKTGQWGTFKLKEA